MRRLVLVLFVLLATMTSSVGAGLVLAQEEAGNATTTTTSSEPKRSTIIARVDSSVVVTSKSYDKENETFFVVLENRGERDVEVTLTEVINAESNSDRFGIARLDVDAGESERVGVSMFTGHKTPGVMITTGESFERGTGALVTVDQPDYSLLRGEASWSDVRAGSAFGIAGAVGVMFLAAWHVVASRNDDVRPVEVEA